MLSSHHRNRYDEDKAFTFIFYGKDLSQEEKERAARYVKAVCANIRGHVKEVIFREDDEERSSLRDKSFRSAGGTVLLNGSMRYIRGNSARLAKQLSSYLEEETETIPLMKYSGDMETLLMKLEDTENIVLCVPLYVDGLPSQVIRFMERYEKEYKGGIKRIYVLANMGLYESRQLVNLLSAVKQWCVLMGFDYGGSLALSAGELVGVLMQHIPFMMGPTKKMDEGMKTLARAIDKGEIIEDIYAEPYHFPRSLYIFIANTNWRITAGRNGITYQDLFRRL